MNIFEWFALPCWLLMAFCAYAMTHGNPGGINGVLGLIPAVIFLTVLAVVKRHHDRRMRQMEEDFRSRAR